MRKFLKYPLFLVIAYICLLNINMLSLPAIIQTQEGDYNKEVYQQLQFLKTKLHNGEGEKMQQIYPEGYMFLHALYGLSWANTVQDLEQTSAIKQEAIKEVKWAIARMENKTAKAPFQEELFLPYGVYYQGWLNYTRAQYLSLEKNSIQTTKYQKACLQIEAAVKHHYTPFLYSYSSGSWPADNMVALAALTAHDRLFPARFDSLRTSWLNNIKGKLDNNGLIPHSVDLRYGDFIGQARGSSQSLILAFLIEIDSNFAQQQYLKYKNLFVRKRFGLPGIKEYTNGSVGLGDIDSGPVILGIGGAASLVGMGTCGQFGDMELYDGLRNSIRGFGMTYSLLGKRRYLFGQLPIADAFIAWSHSRVPLKNLSPMTPFNYFTFRIISLSIVLLLIVIIKLIK